VCYLTDQLTEALAARRRAMELFELAADPGAVGRSQRWLSRLSWFLARHEDSERYARRAVATLEPLGASAELAMAYSNVAQLRMLGGDNAAAVDWGARALAMAEDVGDREVRMHALNNVGTALARNDRAEGWRSLEESLEMALDDDAHEHAARAYTNLACTHLEHYRIGVALQAFDEGIDYCDERDLDSWIGYMGAWKAVALAEQGRYEEALGMAEGLLGSPLLSPVSRIQALLVTARIGSRRGQDVGPALDQAATLAKASGEAQRMIPAAAARAEAAWLAGRAGTIAADVDPVWQPALDTGNGWRIGELAWWLAVAGVPRPSTVRLAAPFAFMLDREWARAARAWDQLGCPMWTAYALGRADDLESARTALLIADDLGAYAVRGAIMRDRHAAGQAVPRGPRPSSRGRTALLTTREMDVLRLVADGMSNADIATALVLSERTVGHHVSSILRKLGSSSRGRAVAAARRGGLLGPT
jgi:DNA-binding CsgD family transcriptional regulator/tetratricopeptide (TPR) repeat protein